MLIIWRLAILALVVAQVDPSPQDSECECVPECEALGNAGGCRGRLVDRADCPCCKVCAQQEGDPCADPMLPCDAQFGLVCSPEGVCAAEFPCKNDESCPVDRFCLGGVCVDPCPILTPCRGALQGSQCVPKHHRPVCECPSGTIANSAGDMCVPKNDTETGCEHEGRLYRKGEKRYEGHCQLECKCGDDGLFSCGPVSCPAGLFVAGQHSHQELCIELRNRPETDECCVVVACANSLVTPSLLTSPAVGLPPPIREEEAIDAKQARALTGRNVGVDRVAPISEEEYQARLKDLEEELNRNKELSVMNKTMSNQHQELTTAGHTDMDHVNMTEKMTTMAEEEEMLMEEIATTDEAISVTTMIPPMDQEHGMQKDDDMTAVIVEYDDTGAEVQRFTVTEAVEVVTVVPTLLDEQATETSMAVAGEKQEETTTLSSTVEEQEEIIGSVREGKMTDEDEINSTISASSTPATDPQVTPPKETVTKVGSGGLKELSVTHNSSTLVLPSTKGGDIYYKATDNTEWQRVPVESGLETFVLKGLQPSTQYTLKWAGVSGAAAKITIDTQDGCIVGDMSYGIGQEWSDGCQQKCSCRAGGSLDCQPRCLFVAGDIKDPQCSERPTPDDPECCVTYDCQSTDTPVQAVPAGTQENTGMPKLIITQKTHNSVTLAWDDFRARTLEGRYVAEYREASEDEEAAAATNTWMRKVGPAGEQPPMLTVDDLKPNTLYEVRVSIYDNTETETEQSNRPEDATETINVRTEPGCIRGNTSHAVGEFFNGCEERCNCMATGVVQCYERCSLPSFRKGSFKGDPLCREQPAVQDECCVIVRCATDTRQVFNQCTNVVCGNNAECVSGALTADDANPDDILGYCRCLDGFIGDASDLDIGCIPDASAGEKSGSCTFKNNTYQPGDVFYDECEYRCSCSGNSEIECEPRCEFPHDDGAKTEPGCQYLPDPEDSCCKLRVCNSTSEAATDAARAPSLPTDGCTKGNITYARNETFYNGCETQCTCIGYGDVSCVPRCPPLKVVSETPKRCETLPDPLDSCCSITVCDEETPDVMKANITEMEMEVMKNATELMEKVLVMKEMMINMTDAEKEMMMMNMTETEKEVMMNITKIDDIMTKNMTDEEKHLILKHVTEMEKENMMKNMTEVEKEMAMSNMTDMMKEMEVMMEHEEEEMMTSTKSPEDEMVSEVHVHMHEDGTVHSHPPTHENDSHSHTHTHDDGITHSHPHEHENDSHNHTHTHDDGTTHSHPHDHENDFHDHIHSDKMEETHTHTHDGTTHTHPHDHTEESHNHTHDIIIPEIRNLTHSHEDGTTHTHPHNINEPHTHDIEDLEEFHNHTRFNTLEKKNRAEDLLPYELKISEVMAVNATTVKMRVAMSDSAITQLLSSEDQVIKVLYSPDSLNWMEKNISVNDITVENLNEVIVYAGDLRPATPYQFRVAFMDSVSPTVKARLLEGPLDSGVMEVGTPRPGCIPGTEFVEETECGRQCTCGSAGEVTCKPRCPRPVLPEFLEGNCSSVPNSDDPCCPSPGCLLHIFNQHVREMMEDSTNEFRTEENENESSTAAGKDDSMLKNKGLHTGNEGPNIVQISEGLNVSRTFHRPDLNVLIPQEEGEELRTSEKSHSFSELMNKSLQENVDTETGRLYSAESNVTFPATESSPDSRTQLPINIVLEQGTTDSGISNIPITPFHSDDEYENELSSQRSLQGLQSHDSAANESSYLPTEHENLLLPAVVTLNSSTFGPMDNFHVPDPRENAYLPDENENVHLPESNRNLYLPDGSGSFHRPDTSENAYLPNEHENVYLPESNRNSYLPDTGNQFQLPDAHENAYLPNENENVHHPESNSDSHLPNTGDRFHLPDASENAYLPHESENTHLFESNRDSYHPDIGVSLHLPDSVGNPHQPDIRDKTYLSNADENSYLPNIDENTFGNDSEISLVLKSRKEDTYLPKENRENTYLPDEHNLAFETIKLEASKANDEEHSRSSPVPIENRNATLQEHMSTSNDHLHTLSKSNSSLLTRGGIQSKNKEDGGAGMVDIDTSSMCLHKGRYYKPDQNFNDGCTHSCICSQNLEVHCAPIECPVTFGLDLIDPSCLEWDVDKDYVPTPPKCCPQVKCISSSACEYMGQTFKNYDQIPRELTGCSQVCTCNYGNVTCRDLCAPVAPIPPPDLNCSPQDAVLITLPDDPCCQTWQCAAHTVAGSPAVFPLPPVSILTGTPTSDFVPAVFPTDSTFGPDNGILQPHVSSLDPHTAHISFSTPAIYKDLPGELLIRFTSDPMNMHDPNAWAQEVVVPMGSIINYSDWEHVVTGLQPATEYMMQIVLTIQGTEPITSPVVTYMTMAETTTQPTTTPLPRLDVNAELYASGITKTSAKVSWRGFNEYELQYIDGVQVKYTAKDKLIPTFSQLFHRDNNQMDIRDLQPGMTYTVDLVFITHENLTTKVSNSNPITFTTLPEEDPYAFEIEVTEGKVSTQTAELFYSGIPEPEEKYVNVYRVVYHREVERVDAQTFKIPKPGQERKIFLSDLKPDVEYQVWLEAYLSNGRKKKSNVITIRTKAGQLPKPERSEVDPSAKGVEEEGNYYAALVAVAIIAAIACLGFLGLLIILLRKQNHAKAHINSSRNNAAYDNPSYKVGDNTYDMEMNGIKGSGNGATHGEDP